MENSKIQWCDHTFNPWTGCTKVSPGCVNCYAEANRARFGHDEWGPGKPRKRTSIANWPKPLAWDKAAAASGTRPRVFCASLADWLDPEVPVEWLAGLLALIAATPNLDWLLLTKRPELWRERLESVRDLGGMSGMAVAWLGGTPPANVWLGTTAEDQRRADERIPALLSIPALVRFLSMEPLLSRVILGSIPAGGSSYFDLTYAGGSGRFSCATSRRISDDRIDWIIVGGESGSGARICNVEWIRSIVRDCKIAGVPVFVKQLGSRAVFTPPDSAPGSSASMHLRDPKGGDPSEWPQDLRVRELPA